VASLLDELQEAGAHEQAAAVTTWLSAADMFGAIPFGRKAARISSGSGGRPTAPRPRHGSGTNRTDSLSLGSGVAQKASAAPARVSVRGPFNGRFADRQWRHRRCTSRRLS
jgi:hypothetical protein